MGNVVGIKWDSEDAAATVAGIVANNPDSVRFINDCGDGKWEAAVSHRQAMRCLEDGALLTEPRFNPETDHWEFRMGRFAAGQDIVIDIAADSTKTQITVIKVCEHKDK